MHTAPRQPILSTRADREAAFRGAAADRDAGLLARLLEADSTLLDLPVQGNLTLMDALPRAQEVCEGLKPPLLAIYHVLKAAGARPSMVAAIRANDLATVERFLAKDPRSAIGSPTGGTVEPNRA